MPFTLLPHEDSHEPDIDELKTATVVFLKMHRIFSRLKLAAGGEKGPPYEYSPIPEPRHVRIVQVQPAGDLKEPLRCSMSFISLDDCDEEVGNDYTALSYSWDAQKPSSPVAVDGGTLLVTPNCEAAMRRLRSSTEAANLWIDSICINQSKDAIEERNKQVAIMGDIYKRAKRVVIWLGESDTKMELAMRTVMHISEDVPGATVREEKREAMKERVGKISRSKIYISKLIAFSRSVLPLMADKWQ